MKRHRLRERPLLRQGRNRIAMSGCSAYQRNDEGYLCSVRISDYAGHEGEIDWSKVAISKEEY